jgi:formyl-CoA transferase
MAAARVPGGRIYTIEDIARDPQYRARDMILPITTRDGLSLEVPGVVPKLSATPGRLRSTAPALGDDTKAVLARYGVSEAEFADLVARKVV